jgi:hypothetical protein
MKALDMKDSGESDANSTPLTVARRVPSSSLEIRPHLFEKFLIFLGRKDRPESVPQLGIQVSQCRAGNGLFIETNEPRLAALLEQRGQGILFHRLFPSHPGFRQDIALKLRGWFVPIKGFIPIGFPESPRRLTFRWPKWNMAE